MSNLTVCQLFGLTSSAPRNSDGAITGSRLLLTGPSLSGKTSLFFNYAMNCAEKGDTVLYIASKPISRLPLFVNAREQPKPDMLKLIKFVYLPNYDELIKFLSSVHIDIGNNKIAGYGWPNHMIIDEFEMYFQEKFSRSEGTTRIARCLAYCIDAVEYFTKLGSNHGKKCHLLIAETVSNDLATDKETLYKHWITTFLKIKQTGQRSFEIKSNSFKIDSGRDDLSTTDIVSQYEISETGIQLDKVEVMS